MIPKILKVTEPCTENWENMTPNEKGRFCDNCQKTVIDFTQMSPMQISDFMKNHTGSLCGRLKGSAQLYPAYTEENRESKNYFPFPGRKMAATAMLASGIAFITPISNHAEIPMMENIQTLLQPKKDNDKKQLIPISNDEIIIKGYISPNYRPLTNIGIAHAKVSLLTREKQFIAYTDANGHFELTVPKEVIQAKNVLYFSYNDIQNLQKFREESSDAIFGFEDGYEVFTDSELQNQITQLADIHLPIAGGIGMFQTDYLVNGQLLDMEQMQTIWESNSQNKSCNIQMEDSYHVYGEAANILAGKEMESGLVVIYDTTEFIENSATF